MIYFYFICRTYIPWRAWVLFSERGAMAGGQRSQASRRGDAAAPRLPASRPGPACAAQHADSGVCVHPQTKRFILSPFASLLLSTEFRSAWKRLSSRLSVSWTPVLLGIWTCSCETNLQPRGMNTLRSRQLVAARQGHQCTRRTAHPSAAANSSSLLLGTKRKGKKMALVDCKHKGQGWTGQANSLSPGAFHSSWSFHTCPPVPQNHLNSV